MGNYGRDRKGRWFFMKNVDIDGGLVFLFLGVVGAGVLVGFICFWCSRYLFNVFLSLGVY